MYADNRKHRLLMAIFVATVSLVIPFAGLAGAQNDLDPAVQRIAGRKGKVQQRELRRLLIHPGDDDHSFYESIFYHEAHLRPALLALVHDPKVGAEAANFLTLIGQPDDVRFIIHHPPPSKGQAFPHRWAYGVACSLLDPTLEEDWTFLRYSAVNKYEDGWVEAGAIQTLKLIASPKSVELLEEIQKQNQSRAREVANALEYARSEPSPLTAPNLKDLAARVAQIIKIGRWEGNGEPKYNEANDKALVDLQFSSGRDLLFYTATFWRMQDLWRLHGVSETGQALLAPPSRR
jgi:hypothetical protein